MSTKNPKTLSSQNVNISVTESGDLTYFIDMANILPAEWKPPQPPEGATLEQKIDWELANMYQIARAWSALSESLKTKAGYSRKLGDGSLILRARKAYAVRTVLRAIAGGNVGGGRKLAQLQIEISPFSDPDTLEISREGQISVKQASFHARFLAALEGKDATRIRQCPGCSHLFWAKPKHKKSCSNSCHVKRWRRLKPHRYLDYYAKYDARLTCPLKTSPAGK